MKFVLTIFILALVGICRGLPTASSPEEEGAPKSNWAARASQIVATNLLKDTNDVDGNQVFSPLGISSVLAILAEGTRGDTYKEFMSALGYPQDKKELRESFKGVLENFHQTDFAKSPSFRTWFYIYRNNTAKQEFRDILRDYYMVDVKDIDKSAYQISVVEVGSPTTVAPSASSNNNSKDIIEFEDLKKAETFDETRKDLPSQEKEEGENSSKFDKVVEDKQYVEIPVIMEEIAKEKEKQDEMPKELDPVEGVLVMVEGETAPNVEENETIKDEEKLEALRKDIESNKPIVVVESSEPEKITIPLKKLEDLEIMQELQSYFVKSRFSRARTLFQKDDVASALSANSVIGKENPSVTKMLLFNGLYYRGNWVYPFHELRNGPEDVFYTSNDKSLPVTMMKSRGQFRTADLKALQSMVIEFPYENKRYSFLAIIPKEKEGLKAVIEKLKPEDIPRLQTSLKDDLINVCLPKFMVEQTTRAESTLKKLGLRTIFTDKADFGDLNDDKDLHIEDVVQHVNVRVDEGASSENFLSGTIASRTDDNDEKSIVIDRPFVFFVMDNEADFVIMAGKVQNPKIEADSMESNE